LKDGAMQFDILHVIDTMPAWSPAISHNRAVDYQVSLTLH